MHLFFEDPVAATRHNLNNDRRAAVNSLVKHNWGPPGRVESSIAGHMASIHLRVSLKIEGIGSYMILKYILYNII
jgi:hypothetical protein